MISLASKKRKLNKLFSYQFITTILPNPSLLAAIFFNTSVLIDWNSTNKSNEQTITTTKSNFWISNHNVKYLLARSIELKVKYTAKICNVDEKKPQSLTTKDTASAKTVWLHHQQIFNGKERTKSIMRRKDH